MSNQMSNSGNDIIGVVIFVIFICIVIGVWLFMGSYDDGDHSTVNYSPANFNSFSSTTNAPTVS